MAEFLIQYVMLTQGQKLGHLLITVVYVVVTVLSLGDLA